LGLTALGLLACPGGAQVQEPLLWPLELQPALSSTFGETRATAFHAGIDLKTWGKTGYEVRAVADGWIQRVRTSPWGYGRALYQQLADGRIAVYAHLQDFFPPVAERVQLAQRAARRYSVQLWPKQDDIPVRRGQVIAHTGQSGAGPPHLHLEIRDASNVPLNPLLQGLGPVLDTTPPTLRRLLLVPLAPSSRVDGGIDPVSVTLVAGPAGLAANRDVRIWGRVGVAVDSYDRADLAPNKLAVLRHDLNVDGDRVLSSSFERVAFGDGHLVALDRLRPESIDGVFTALFRRPGNRLRFYDIPVGDGSLMAGVEPGLPSGRHEVVVTAHDVVGNRTRARLQLVVSAPPQVAAARLVRGAEAGWFVEADFFDEDDERLTATISDASTGTVVHQLAVAVGAGPFTWALPADYSVTAWLVKIRDEAGNEALQSLAVPRPIRNPSPFRLDLSAIPRGRQVLLRVTSPEALQQRPRLVVAGMVQHLQQESAESWLGTVSLPAAETDEVAIQCTALAADGGQGRGSLTLSGRAARPGRAQVIRLLEGDVALHLAAGSAYEVFYPQALRLVADVGSTAAGGLVVAGSGCTIGPADAAFDEWARISMKVDGSLDQIGIYADDGQGGWAFIGADQDGTDRLSAPIRALGKFALMKDGTAPRIADVRPEAGQVVAADIEFSARVVDDGSGIKREEDVQLELDGDRLIAEYDPEADRVTAAADQPLQPGTHQLVVTLRDAVGNETVVTTDFISR
jgi:hypothetical protein